MTPKLRVRIRAIASLINDTGEPSCVWILDKGRELGFGAVFPRRVPFSKHVGRYTAPCAHSDIAEDVEYVLDELAHASAGRDVKSGRPRLKSDGGER